MMAIDTQPEQITTIQRSAAPGCLIQALWFVFIGWWLGALSIAAAWFLNITIIGLPLGMAIPPLFISSTTEKRIPGNSIKWEYVRGSS